MQVYGVFVYVISTKENILQAIIVKVCDPNASTIIEIIIIKKISSGRDIVVMALVRET